MRRVRVLLAQPISDEERPRLFALVAAALLATAGMLTVIAPRPDQPTAAAPSTTGTLTAPQPAPSGPPAAVIDAARAFVGDYLAFLAGPTAGRPVFDYASARLARRLAAYPVRVLPAAGDRRAQVVRLEARRATGRSRWVVRASIADGVASYPIELVVAVRGGQPVVTQIGEE